LGSGHGARAIRGTIEAEMTAPATPARPGGPAAPSAPAPTHPCARCGDPVALDVGLCERCNPLGLRDSASSQVHGTAILAVGLAIGLLAIITRLSVSGIGPFNASVTGVRAGATAGTLIATVQVRNEGTTIGSATCRLTDPSDPGLVNSALMYSPRIEPGATVTFDQEVTFGSLDGPLTATCRGP
jgi:hypothetical protein